MRITNLTHEEILCSIDNILWTIDQGNSMEIDTFNNIKFMHKCACYSSSEVGNSNVLKLLSLLDDPLKLRREYHIVIDVQISARDCNPQEIVVLSHTDYVDVETRTYYEYFLAWGDGKVISPDRFDVPGKEGITREFQQNNAKLVRWNAIWDVIIEPILFELIGYYLLYNLFSIWLGNSALFVVVLLVMINILIELAVLGFRFKDKRMNRFLYYTEDTTIREICYDRHSNVADGLGD